MESASWVPTKSMAEIVVIHKCWAMRDVGRVVIDHRPVLPVESPVDPSPPKPPEETQSESHAKGNSWSTEIEPRIRIPAGPHSEWCAIHKPGIVLRDVDNIGVNGFNRDSLPLCCYFFLLSAL